jgi:hypothetical protein
MTHERNAATSSEDVPNDMIDSLRVSLDAATDAERILILSARLAAFGIERPFREWPSLVDREKALELPSLLEARCHRCLLELDDSRGEALGRAFENAQDIHCLHVMDRRHGALLAAAHPVFDGLSHVCSRLLLDDEAAAWVEERSHERRCDLMDPEAVLPAMLHPIGDSARTALASEIASRDFIPVVEVTPLPVFEGELVFDGGRPSARMIRRFAERCGLIRCQDGSECEVRAVLEEDWRISIQFNGQETWCRRIDRVRLGSRTALPDDERRDFWVTSLQSLGLDAQTRLVGQPILVALTNGERFSL